MERQNDAAPPPEVQTYYSRYPEESRLELGTFRLEFERTKEILTRVLPTPPARIVDVGGAAGAYSFWLAARGYEVHLIDASARLVEEARARNATSRVPIASLAVADARRLPREDGSAAAVLVMGPLYHLPQAPDRVPTAVEPREQVLEDFDRLQEQLVGYVRDADGLDLGRLRIVSPFDTRLKYNLYSCLTIIPAHQRLHLAQAAQVIHSLRTA